MAKKSLYLALLAVAFALGLANSILTATPTTDSPAKPDGEPVSAPDAGKIHRDFPAMALPAHGAPFVAFIRHEGDSDILKLARYDKTLQILATVSTPGIVHQPAVAVAGDSAVWCFWGQVDSRDIVTLRARRFVDGKLGDEITLASSDACDTFADAGTDAAGRVWVAWQSMRRGQGDIFTRYLDPKTNQWSKEFALSKPEGGNWEPRLAFDGRDGAWIAFDSSRGREFNLFLAHVGLDGSVEEKQITDSPEYEARASIAAAPDGKSLWIAAERGHRDWGLPTRGHDQSAGFNGQKRILLGRYDIASGKFTEVPVPQQGRLAPHAAAVVNVPTVTVDAAGNPILAWRYYTQAFWRLCVDRYDPATNAWSQPVEIPDSAFCQDRHACLARDGSKIWLCWPSDRRTSKEVQRADVFLSQLDTDWKALHLDAIQAEAPLKGVKGRKNDRPPAPIAGGSAAPDSVYFLPPTQSELVNPRTPPRPRDEHMTWQIGGKTYTLVFGDLHRHTDFSNCITSGDGCALEHFRYACDIAALDFLGTSDHTDIAKIYDPYEWWQTQRTSDVFYAPGRFNPLYAYEREQTYPWGHRNVVFAQRGGPIVYIQKPHYNQSPWASLYPLRTLAGDAPEIPDTQTDDGETNEKHKPDAKSGVKPGKFAGARAAQISPMQLWDILDRYGKPVAVISHTGGTGMGTNWDLYKKIDGKVENTVEIYQGARVSYEGRGAPQPTVGLRVGEPYNAAIAKNQSTILPAVGKPITDFGGEHNKGLYQHALADGFKLGVFASSDHISQHCSFGGVFVETNSRTGIVEGLRRRISIAATDKIFLTFSCNDHPMGEVFDSGSAPRLKFAVGGTAPIQTVTLIRNEQNYKSWSPANARFEADFTDEHPLPGENRYYLRVEQTDGNMAWSSPVWVTMKK